MELSFKNNLIKNNKLNSNIRPIADTEEIFFSPNAIYISTVSGDYSSSYKIYKGYCYVKLWGWIVKQTSSTPQLLAEGLPKASLYERYCYSGCNAYGEASNDYSSFMIWLGQDNSTQKTQIVGNIKLSTGDKASYPLYCCFSYPVAK